MTKNVETRHVERVKALPRAAADYVRQLKSKSLTNLDFLFIFQMGQTTQKMGNGGGRAKKKDKSGY